MRLSLEVFHADVAVPVDFYERVLGFERVPGGAPDHVVLERGSVRLACCHDARATTTPRRPPDGPEVVLRVADVEAEHDRVTKAGWPVDEGLRSRPWGHRDFRVLDPTGLYLRISEE